MKEGTLHIQFNSIYTLPYVNYMYIIEPGCVIDYFIIDVQLKQKLWRSFTILMNIFYLNLVS